MVHATYPRPPPPHMLLYSVHCTEYSCLTEKGQHLTRIFQAHMQPHDPNGGKIQRFRSHPKQYAKGSDIVLFSEFRKPAKSCRSGLFLEAQFQKIVNFRST